MIENSSGNIVDVIIETEVTILKSQNYKKNGAVIKAIKVSNSIFFFLSEGKYSETIFSKDNVCPSRTVAYIVRT